MSKQVVGVYETAEEAIATLENLRSRGYSKDDITLAANQEVRQTIPYGYEDNVEDTNATSDSEDKSFWDSVKDAFTFEDTNEDNVSTNDTLLSGYKDQMDRGHIAVLVDSDEKVEFDATENVEGQTDDTVARGRAVDPVTGAAGANANTASGNINDDLNPGDIDYDAAKASRNTTPDLDRDLTEEESIQLREERLNVEKDNVQTGEVHIKKEIVEDTETIEVPTTHEEVTIERKPVDKKVTDTSSGEIVENEDEIVIPVHEEQVNVSKENVVTEEVDIERKQVTEDKQVTDQVKREELDVETDGDIDVDKDKR